MVKKYEQIQSIMGQSITPYDVNNKCANIELYILMMLNRTQSLFRYSGLPDSIPQRDLELLLQVGGFCGITNVDGTLYALSGGLGGERNAYYNPTILTVANPYLRYNENLKIGEDCVLIKSDSMLLGLYPIIAKYAQLLAENDITLKQKDILSRVPFLVSAGDDRTRASAEKFLIDVIDGRLGIIGENVFFEDLKISPTAQVNTNMTDSIEYHQYLRSGLFSEIGLKSNYNMKRESLNAAETNADNDVLLPLIDDMLRCRQTALEEVNKKYGTNITVELYSAWADNENESEVDEDGDLQSTTENNATND